MCSSDLNMQISLDTYRRLPFVRLEFEALFALLAFVFTFVNCPCRVNGEWQANSKYSIHNLHGKVAVGLQLSDF